MPTLADFMLRNGLHPLGGWDCAMRSGAKLHFPSAELELQSIAIFAMIGVDGIVRSAAARCK